MNLGLALAFGACLLLLGALAVVMALDAYREARTILRGLRNRPETPPRPLQADLDRIERGPGSLAEYLAQTDPGLVTHDDVLGLIPPSIRHKFRTPRA